MNPQESNELKQFLKDLLTDKKFDMDDDIDNIIEGLLLFGKRSYPKIAKEYHITEITVKRKALKIFKELTVIIKDWKTIKIQQSNFTSTLRDFYDAWKQNQRPHSLENFYSSNGIVISIFDNLKQKITQLTPEQKSKFIQKTKTYFIDNLNYQDLIFAEEIIEEILKEDNLTRVHLLTNLVQNADFDGNIIHILKETLQTLKQQLNINDEDLPTQDRLLINPENITIGEDVYHGINSHLILKIQRSDSQLEDKKPQYKIESAFLLNPSTYPPNDEDYNSLNQIIQASENGYKRQNEHQEYLSRRELQPILTELIDQCFSQPCQDEQILVIDFFCEQDLLSTDFDVWKCDFEGGDCTLKELYQIRVRSLSRLEPKYRQSKLYRKWQNKWEEVQQNLTLSTHQKAWLNLCSSQAENLPSLLRQLLISGIPIAIWSRCHKNHQQHEQEINSLVTNCKGNLNHLSTLIEERRTNCLSVEQEPENLGHHLSLLWEDPNIIPPFANIASGHFGQSS